MSEKLWFISEESDVIAIFDNQEKASKELFNLKEVDPSGIFHIYGISFDDLESYSSEYDLALSEGFFDE